jgi:hypothetical protein
MRAYSENLCRNIIDTLERGVSKAGVSRLSGVSLSSVKRYARMAQKGWSLAPRKGFGCLSKIKGIRGEAEASTREPLVVAMDTAISAVTYSRCLEVLLALYRYKLSVQSL